MSVFDGLAEAMQSDPPPELTFTYRDISVLLDALYHYLSWLRSEYDQSAYFYCTHDIPDYQLTEGLISKFLSLYYFIVTGSTFDDL